MLADPNKLSQFWQELKRRKVIRVITVYAAAAFVILELTDIVAPSLGLPDWTLNFIIILLCVGFIISVIVSWIYNIHPEGGIVKTEPAIKVSEESVHPSSNGWKIASYISFVVIGALIVLNILLRIHPSLDNSFMGNSIAVLPFEDMSTEKDQEYFCDGITIEIINSLLFSSLGHPGRILQDFTHHLLLLSPLKWDDFPLIGLRDFDFDGIHGLGEFRHPCRA